jgi:hypothetical protein
VFSLDGCQPWIVANADGRGYYRTEYAPEVAAVLSSSWKQRRTVGANRHHARAVMARRAVFVGATCAFNSAYEAFPCLLGVLKISELEHAARIGLRRDRPVARAVPKELLEIYTGAGQGWCPVHLIDRSELLHAHVSLDPSD